MRCDEERIRSRQVTPGPSGLRTTGHGRSAESDTDSPVLSDGKIDESLKGSSRRPSPIQIVERKPISEIDDQTLVTADVGRNATTQLKQFAATAKELGLPVNTDIPQRPCLI